MKKSLWYNVILIFCISLLTGCNETVDLTKGHFDRAPLCELHHCHMLRERIHVAGEIVYYPDYAMICQEQFPNHGRHRYNGEKEGTPRDKDVIDFVCYKCDWAYERYWENVNNSLINNKAN